MMRFWRFLAAMRRIRLTEAEKEALHPRHVVVTKHSPVRLLESMDEKTFFTSAKAIALSPRERVMMKEAILAHTTGGSFWSIRWKSFSSVLASVLIVTITGSGLSYAAENTVPGDVLYPVKIVNEEMTSRLMRTEEDRALFEAKRAGRRLEEAHTLTSQGNVDTETMSKLEVSFQKHASEVREHMIVLKNAQKSDELATLSLTFNAALKERTQELKHTNGTTEMQPLLRRVHSTRVGMKEVELESMNEREERESATMTAPAFRTNKRAVLEMGLTMESETPEPTVTNEQDEKDRDEARTTSVRVIEETQPAITVQRSATNESDDEELIEVEALVNVVRRKLHAVETQLSSLPTAMFRTQLQEIRTLLDQATRAMNAGNITEASVAVSTALAKVRTIEVQMKTGVTTEASTTTESGVFSSALKSRSTDTSVDGSLKLK